MMRALKKEHNEETWNGSLEWKSIDSVLKLEELGEPENNKLELDMPYSRTCTGELMKMRIDSERKTAGVGAAEEKHVDLGRHENNRSGDGRIESRRLD
eukprot:2673077-Heterocapsa_arctica.AAC.1